MENEVQVFDFEQMNVRTAEIDGEVWFVATDVAAVLEIKNTTDALKRLDDDERARFNLGRQGEANVISEAGLYRFIGASRKPEAKRFIRWVTHEVLPSIRKTGSYQAKPMTFDEKLALALQSEQDTRQRVGTLEGKVDNIIVNQPVNATDYAAIGEAVSNRVHEWAKVHRVPSKQRGPLFKDLNSQIKQVTGAGNRTRIKSSQYDMVINFIDTWQLSC